MTQNAGDYWIIQNGQFVWFEHERAKALEKTNKSGIFAYLSAIRN
jgi:hypothetical protein